MAMVWRWTSHRTRTAPIRMSMRMRIIGVYFGKCTKEFGNNRMKIWVEKGKSERVKDLTLVGEKFLA